ncbi:MAG: hypothetical protein JSW18_04985 [Candidatus Omnitrophota bacterium]|nr:MAG: hypothetical protein JSW18_04985 [Candidatus Omnitrophota bacterium]
MKVIITIVVAALLIVTICNIGQCDEKTAQNLLKQGLLGAATGAVSSEVSGGKAGTGALVGAGVNIVGGMLFDSMTGKRVEEVKTVEGMGSTEAFQRGYQSGYQQGFEKGYSEGHQAGLGNK